MALRVQAREWLDNCIENLNTQKVMRLSRIPAHPLFFLCKRAQTRVWMSVRACGRVGPVGEGGDTEKRVCSLWAPGQ